MIFLSFPKTVSTVLFSNLFRKCTNIENYRNISIFNGFMQKKTNDDIFEGIESDNAENREYEQLVEKVFVSKDQSCFIINPYIKWGPKKKTGTSPQNDLSEAESLVNTLSGWSVYDKTIVPLETFDKKTIFGSGTLDKLIHKIRNNREITAVFINLGTLRNIQINELEQLFGVQILDRYKIVMQILKQHAISKHAKLQVALAEIPYLRSRLKYIEIGSSHNWQIKDKMLAEREVKLRKSLKKLRSQRELLRNKRKDLSLPMVAVVGYTNVGKTSLIKSLTGDKTLQPRKQLFATLDVTVHSGLLPSKLNVLYIDTVGFISDIPTDLIECFIATLEDAMLADTIIHVNDVSNENVLFQRKHVELTLESLAKKVGNEDLLKKIISVGNKADMAVTIPEIISKDSMIVSAKNMSGIDLLQQKIESMILKTTGRQNIIFRIPNGGDEMRWLFKNATVTEQQEDEDNSQFQFLQIIITEAKLKQFYVQFVAKK